MIRKSDPQTIAPYLKDASNYSGGCADEVIIPETSQELVQFLKSNDRPITIAGAGTGLTASRIPESGIIISLEKFNTVGNIENSAIDVGPAVSLKALQTHLLSTPFYYPPNPTESLASIGGTVATNASGSRSYKLGVTRNYVLEMDLALANGKTVTLTRGQTVDEPLTLDDGSKITFPKITYESPHFKNAAGYYVHPGMDWLDLFIGSDGTLALVTRIRLKLLLRPEEFISGILFFDREEACWELVDTIRSLRSDTISPCALEYFDKFSLKKLKPTHSQIPECAHAALFFEQAILKKQEYESVLESWFEFLSLENVSLDDSWFAQNEKDRQRFHDFRHDIPIIINEENSRLGRVKIGTDMAVANEHFMDMMHFYRQELSESGLEFVVFGHLGDNHLHINLLPGPEELDCAKTTYDRLVDQILEWKGTISAEHGIGKLKKAYFAKMVGPEVLGELKTIKQALDPRNLLGRGNIL